MFRLASCRLLLPSAPASLPADCLLALRRVEELAGLDDVFLVVVLAVAVDVHLDFDLVALAVAALAHRVGEAVLAAHERVDRLERCRKLAGGGDGEGCAARPLRRGA